MKKTILLLLILAPGIAYSQNSDCNTAISVCEGVYTESNSPAGTGSVFEVAPGSCQTSGEFNSAWYVFTAQEDGSFGFILEPNSVNDDYDWSVYNITENGCAGISTGASPEVSCNSYGEVAGVQGATGISTAMGGAGNSNGPGNLNGPIFNQDLQVSQGQVFALVIMNYSATLNGYDLDFTNSQVPIFDNTPPAVANYAIGCDQSSIIFELTESVLTDGLIPANISFTIGGDALAITSITNTTPLYSNSFEVNVANLSAQQGTGTFTFSGAITDICGNPIEITFDVELAGSVAPTITTSPACIGENGGLQVAIPAGNPCYSFELDGATVPGAACDGFTINNLDAGDYTLTLINTVSDCEQTFDVVIDDIPLDINAGADQVLCDMNTALEATFSGGALQWQNQADITFLSPTAGNSIVQATQPGAYDLVATVSQNGCSVSDVVNVTFNFPPNMEITVTNQNCEGICDGEVRLQSLAGDITATMNGETLSGTDLLFSGVCAGSYAPFVQFSADCAADYDVDVALLSTLSVDFQADPWLTDIQNTEINFQSIVNGADSLQWIIEPIGLTSNEEAWQAILPEVAGIYNVTLFAYDQFGCIKFADAQIDVRDAFFVYVPNAITPDGDGLNEIFKPVFSYTPQEYLLQIFDRWGQLVFTSTNPDEAWIANFSGGEYFVGSDVYVWQMKARGLSPDIQSFSGSVQVIR